ncbi:MAG TPA: cytidine deaminase [Phenylobacterium sp.]|jgi:cytidine deaminase|uniref:cytidine deaminase n=1 Tax=Phenylobacterium sp. TaxID=1871053 RepID=UPI002C5F7678|nr:cytidine deaminase [Phenylobacterium sp.]HXA38081.1 cytidine deaminase [Phenylobacterium sp.]
MTDLSQIAGKLRALLPRAHAPYSGVQVACAVEGADGTTHLGVNVENAAYPQGLCAEASAISAAVTQGTTALTRVYVASSLPGLVWPCGGCRQKIFEFASEGCEIVALGPDGEVGRQTIEQLLPLGFRLDPAQVRRG